MIWLNRFVHCSVVLMFELLSPRSPVCQRGKTGFLGLGMRSKKEAVTTTHGGGLLQY